MCSCRHHEKFKLELAGRAMCKEHPLLPQTARVGHPGGWLHPKLGQDTDGRVWAGSWKKQAQAYSETLLWSEENELISKNNLSKFWTWGRLCSRWMAWLLIGLATSHHTDAGEFVGSGFSPPVGQYSGMSYTVRILKDYRCGHLL